MFYFELGRAPARLGKEPMAMTSVALPSTKQPLVMTRAATPSAEQLLDRAAELGPVLDRRAAKASELRRIPDETIADFREAGFFRMLQPARYGGFELDPQRFFDVQIEIA